MNKKLADLARHGWLIEFRGRWGETPPGTHAFAIVCTAHRTDNTVIYSEYGDTAKDALRLVASQIQAGLAWPEILPPNSPAERSSR